VRSICADSALTPSKPAILPSSTITGHERHSIAGEDPQQERLFAYLAGFGPDFRDLQGMTPISGGQSNPTYLLDAPSRRYVLRRKPYGRLLSSAHAIDREFRVLRALEKSAVPVPKPLLYCADPGVIGSEFYVMDFVAGRTFWDPMLSDLSPVQRASIYQDMNRVLALLHQVEPTSIGLGDYGRGTNYFERQIRRWSEQYRASATGPRADMERLMAWLPANVPSGVGEAVSLVHGDFRLDNLIFDDAGRVVALLDWELSTLGHPIADLAYQCAQWRLPTGPMRGLKGVEREELGIPSESEYIERYCRRRGLPGISCWHFYLAFSLFRLASICQGVYRRGLEGNASDPLALEFGRRTAVIAAEAVAILTQAGA